MPDNREVPARTAAICISWPRAKLLVVPGMIYSSPACVAEGTLDVQHAGIFGALAGAVCLAGSLSFTAMAQGTAPDFAPSSIGVAYNRIFIPRRACRPGHADRAHPYVPMTSSRDRKAADGSAGDLEHPILQPWARDVVRNAQRGFRTIFLRRPEACSLTPRLPWRRELAGG